MTATVRPVPEVSPIDAAFGGGAMKILPPMADIPAGFKPVSSSSYRGERHYTCADRAEPATKWLNLVSDWFFCGLKDVNWTPKPGVDTTKALRAIKCCIGSFEPSHEHKEAGCAFLLSEWFEDVTYAKAK